MAGEKVEDVDLVICGEGSGDLYSQQLGNMLGGMLGWPTLNSVRELKYEDGKVIDDVSTRFGCRFKSKAELVGGVILVAMGAKILVEHLVAGV